MKGYGLKSAMQRRHAEWRPGETRCKLPLSEVLRQHLILIATMYDNMCELLSIGEAHLVLGIQFFFYVFWVF